MGEHSNTLKASNKIRDIFKAPDKWEGWQVTGMEVWEFLWGGGSRVRLWRRAHISLEVNEEEWRTSGAREDDGQSCKHKEEGKDIQEEVSQQSEV